MTAVQWLRAFAQNLEETHTVPYENVQILRKIAKYVDELEQCNRDAVRFNLEVTDLLVKVRKYINTYA